MEPEVVGVTGLPCAGKSLAARLLAEFAGGRVIQADRLGHQILAKPETETELRRRWGDEIVSAGRPAETRRRIARRVFADPEALAWLEALVHPQVIRETSRLVRDRGGLTVIEAALLFAAGMEKFCGHILLIEADFSLRLERALRRGWSREEFERRDARLLPLFPAPPRPDPEKALFTIRNDDDDDRLASKVAAAWNRIIEAKGIK
ncbi:MAG: dephospho-CoA kinase [Planctomycetota bacterium]|nr:dephospho-CoA kinase [Planctomycetota bacterium]